MSLSDQHVTELSRGTAYSFADWPNPSVPAFGAGVYTVWHHDGFYVGMSACDFCRSEAATVVRISGVRSGGGPPRLWHQLSRHGLPCRYFRGQDPEGGASGRPAGRAVDRPLTRR